MFLNFNRIRKLTTNISDIQKAIGKSQVLELTEDNTKVRRKVPLKVKDDVDECTVYVESLKPDADHDWLKSVFSEFGNVVYVSIPKYKQNKVNKGFAFVEFETCKEAANALEHFESIGCKMPSDTMPEALQSIVTFEGDAEKEGNEEETTVKEESAGRGDKRKNEESSDGEEASKKIKTESEENVGEEEKEKKELESEEESKKRKKSKKEHKKKNALKELGLRVLSK